MSSEHKTRSDRRKKSEISIMPDLCVDDLMRYWPETIRVFLDYRMLCVGCPIGRFHTVAEACEKHDVRLKCFIADIKAAVLATSKPGFDLKK
jgi:hybrid cluster-associated redox disulfide protein